MSSGWDWELTDRTKRELGNLDEYAQERIVSKLDEIVDDPWREPTDYIEPVQGSPNSKLRIGQFRLGCRLDHTEQVLYVARIRKRGGDAYRSDD